MAREPGVLGRRLALLAATVLFVVIAVMNLSNLPTILSREEPRRTLRLGLAGSSLSLGSIMVALLVFDLRGRPTPLPIALRAAWLVVGLNLIDESIPRHSAGLLTTGVLAGAMGLWGVAGIFLHLRRGVAS